MTPDIPNEKKANADDLPPRLDKGINNAFAYTNAPIAPIRPTIAETIAI